MLRRLLALSLAALAACAPPAAAPRVGAAFPHAAVATLDGAPVDAASVIAGRPALVVVWATWCAGCARELDDVARVAASQTEAVVVGVSIDESRDEAATFVRARGLTFRGLVDPQQRVLEGVGARSVPTTIVVDRRGRVVHVGGGLDAAALEALRRAALP